MCVCERDSVCANVHAFVKMSKREGAKGRLTERKLRNDWKQMHFIDFACKVHEIAFIMRIIHFRYNLKTL